jgi:polysaccharide export outer membrane protein
MKMLFRTLTVFIIFVSAGIAAKAQTETDPSPQNTPISTAVAISGNERYRIGFQDTLEIQVFGQPKLTQRVTVNPNGTINLFRLPDPIVAVCKTERELSTDVAAAYEKDYLRNPEVQVVVVEQRSQSFAVIGAVEKPGNYFINRKIRLLELLAQAGGPSNNAGSRIIIARTGSSSDCKLGSDQAANDDDLELLNFRLSDVLAAKTDLIMQPGDIVSVMDADVIYVYGNVNHQGKIEVKEPVTLTQAIASAQGLKPSTQKDKVRVFRQKPDSLERDEFIFSLSDIEKHKIQDPFLEPNDIVAVNEDKVKGIFNTIKNGLTGGIPSIFYRIP